MFEHEHDHASTTGVSFEAHEYAETLSAVRKLLVIALTFWPLFGLLDWMVVTFITPGRLWVYWGLRAIGLLPLVALMLRLRRAPPLSRRVLLTWDLFNYSLASALIGLMCVEYDGLSSPYTVGVVLVVAARGSIMALHWRRALAYLGVIAAAQPVTLLSACLWSEKVRAQLAEPHAVALLLEYLFFLFAALVIVVLASQVSWRLRREVFEARQRVGRYQLRRRIGSGGMGEVWEAFDTVLKRGAALKFLAARRSTPEDIARFQREVRATAELSHPNTVRVFDYGVTHDGRWYYTMEFLRGSSLRELVEQSGALLPARAANIVAQVASALGEAHGRGIVHRDVKPDNVFVTPTSGGDHVKLLDFGIASIAENRTYAAATQGTWMGGTPHFMAPEIIRGDSPSPSCDVYALGATLYFLLCGKPPFCGRSVGETLHAHLNASVPPPSRSREGPGIPPELERIVLRCLAKDPSQRYASAEALAGALRTWNAPAGPAVEPGAPVDVGIGPARTLTLHELEATERGMASELAD